MSDGINTLEKKHHHHKGHIEVVIRSAGDKHSKFVKSVDFSKFPHSFQEKWWPAFNQKVSLHIVSPHTFTSEEKISFASSEGEASEKKHSPEKNISTLSKWGQEWLEKYAGKVRFYEPGKTASSKTFAEFFYSRFLIAGNLNSWDRSISWDRCKRYCFWFFEKKLTREQSLEALFDNIHRDVLTFLNLDMEAGTNVSDWVIFVNNQDLFDLKKCPFNLSACELKFEEVPSLLPGEYLIAHKNMGVHLHEEAGSTGSFSLGINDGSWVASYGMPVKFRAADEAYDSLFVGFWNIFRYLCGPKVSNTEDNTQKAE